MDERDPFYNEHAERMYRPPLLMTLVFVITMLAIYFMGRTVSGFYEGALLPTTIAALG